MATKEEIQAKLAANQAMRESLAAKIGPAQNDAQYAFDALQSAKRLREQNVSESFTASYNGQTFTGPSAVEDYIAATQADFDRKRDIRKQLAVEFNALFPEKEKLEAQLNAVDDKTEPVKDTEGVTQPDPAAADEADNFVPLEPAGSATEESGDEALQAADDAEAARAADMEGKAFADTSSEQVVRQTRSGVPAGAERSAIVTPASAEWAESKDLRVMLRVPKNYLVGPAAGPGSILTDFGGILFPYTPTVSYDSQAVYGSVNPVHSNYTQYFYKNSQVGTISVSGKFTVKNEKEGKIYLAIVHLLRSLTKMRWGSDAEAGSPPPVCRLEAYGDYMLRNIPVVVTSFKFDMPEGVDFMSVKGEYKNSLVPTISTIALGLNVMYSRREMQDFSVDKWLQGSLRGQGYL